VRLLVVAVENSQNIASLSSLLRRRKESSEEPSSVTSFVPTMSVRKSPPPGPGLAVQKRARVDDEEDESMQTLTVSASNAEGKGALVRSIKRTSGLENPIMSLGGAHSVRRSCSAWT
jgi:hypothetical protein